MSCLIRCMFTFDDGTVIHDETTLCELPEILRIDKGMELLGRHGRLTIEFDPPVLVEIDAD